MVRDPLRTDVDCTLRHTRRNDLGGRNTGEKKDEKNKSHGRQKPYHLELLLEVAKSQGKGFLGNYALLCQQEWGLSGVVSPKTGTLSSLVPTIRGPGAI